MPFWQHEGDLCSITGGEEKILRFSSASYLDILFRFFYLEKIKNSKLL